MFEPQRRADNKQWKRKDKKRPCIAKRTISSKKMLYAVFFNSSGPVVQVSCPSGHNHWPILQEFCTEESERVLQQETTKQRMVRSHDNASSHKCEIVKSFLASEKVKVLNHPPYSPGLSPCDFFLFPRLKKMLSGRLEVLLAALFISVSNRYQKKTIYLLFATG